MVVAQRGLKMDTFPLGRRIRIGIAGYSPPKIYRRSPAQASSSSKENLKWKRENQEIKKFACGTYLDRHTFVKSGASYCAGLNAFPRSSEPILWLVGWSDGRDRKLGKVWSLSRWQAETPAPWSMSTTSSPCCRQPSCLPGGATQLQHVMAQLESFCYAADDHLLRLQISRFSKFFDINRICYVKNVSLECFWDSKKVKETRECKGSSRKLRKFRGS